MGQAGNWLLLIGIYAGLRLYGATQNFYHFASRREPAKPESGEIPPPALSGKTEDGHYDI
jgi:hypothetical protein